MGKNNSKMNPEQLDDLRLNTEFNDAEIKEWYKAFTLDFPGGRLNRAQFKKLYKNIFPSGDESTFVEHAFKTFDKDGDGFVDFREFMMSMSITTRGNTEQRLEWAFSMYDLDGDGCITRDEMLEIVRSVQRMVGNNKVMIDNTTPEQRVDHIFDLMDTNKDGKLSKEEFIRGSQNDNTVSELLSFN